MHNLQKLRVYHVARENLRTIITLTKSMRDFGDLKNQIQRSALSVVSNIAEATGTNSPANFNRFLGYAKASNRELQTQLEILADLNPHNKTQTTIQNIDHVGAMLYKLMNNSS